MSLCEPVFSTVRDRPFVLVFANEKGGGPESLPWLFIPLYPCCNVAIR